MDDILRDIAPTSKYHPFMRAFDAAAPTYDADYGYSNAIMRGFRVRSLRILRRVLPRDGGLLELGCGTGVEAVMLAGAAQGRLVLATDLSQEMLKQAQQRAKSEGVSNIMFLQMAAGDVRELKQRFPYPPFFTGAYSSFGALNCEPDLRRVAAGLALVLPPGAPFVVSVINKWCVWEMAWYAAHGDMARARRRVSPIPPAPRHSPEATRRGDGESPPETFPNLPQPRPPREGGEGRTNGAVASPPFPGGPGGIGLAALPIHYLTPRALADAFAPYFRVESREGMGVALPPPSLAPWLARRPRLAALLTASEARLRRVSAAAWLGDHVLMVLRRTTAAAEAA